MCTAITFSKKDHYFGRNLDLEYSYNETVTITPRNFPFHFRKAKSLEHHYAIIGMAYVANDYPLYYDAVNEYGLAMAGLNFPQNATYYEAVGGKDNVTPFEMIPWILGQCKDIKETKELLSHMNILNEAFSEQLPLTPLHWIIADKESAIVVETLKDGMRIHDNPVGVLTNNPPFESMFQFLTLYRGLSSHLTDNRFAKDLELPEYSRGLGALGLPGDYSSVSRFVKASFVKFNSLCDETEIGCVNQFFHILGSVEMPRGSVLLGEDKIEITVYSSCCNQDKGIYYYITYDNHQIASVDMHKEDLDGDKLKSYDLLEEHTIYKHN